MGYKFTDSTTLNLEYRLLRDLRAEDKKEGSVVGVGTPLSKMLEVGIGVNYSGFSDDLGLLDYTDEGAFLRITGVLQ